MTPPRYPRYNPKMTPRQEREFLISALFFVLGVILSVLCLTVYVIGMY